ncbi:hypothetical protein C477_15255 [Haloterrigena salina JCM 13891]|uniref:Uncharacterized protein n=1 Tax=Haloterrigena salina JCM 13891 TaxID=1227488 RepID=M0C0L2_9EURY|nr:hypothetical protein [Haloterrigena salina]ELZ16745.1 hypothetical protein C477_15255 [Haloterrigena salina JCM 13891]
MKWRCTWCGKPHAENDPPCDNCGHNTFEKAVVREGEGETEAERSESSRAASSDPAVDTGVTETETVDTGTTYVWRCQDCGRDHVKYNPPCSRCGNHDLEKIEQRYDDVDGELETSSWLEVAKPYAPILAVIVVVAALFATGVVPLSIVPGVGEPSPPDAPGEGSQAAGIDLEATELEVHDRLEAERDSSRSYDDGLAAYAEYNNRAHVASQHDGTDSEGVRPSDFGVDCGSAGASGQLTPPLSIDDYDDEAALADDIAGGLETSDAVTDPELEREGLDLHVVEGSVYVHYAAC